MIIEIKYTKKKTKFFWQERYSSAGKLRSPPIWFRLALHTHTLEITPRFSRQIPPLNKHCKVVSLDLCVENTAVVSQPIGKFNMKTLNIYTTPPVHFSLSQYCKIQGRPLGTSCSSGKKSLIGILKLKVLFREFSQKKNCHSESTLNCRSQHLCIKLTYTT